MLGTQTDGIVLLAKQPGITSFSSLHNVKKALGTKKVGHTGTLDSFAQGLLVVCAGRLTRLAGNITEFDKTYRAVIQFGAETDTLEYTGRTVRTAPLPSVPELEAAIARFTGEQMQTPPAFSALHVDGRRASDLARSGETVRLPPRNITVYSARLLETRCDESGGVTACMAEFSVSKGTYIRCLARDIAAFCNSAGHLSALYRTKIGNFLVEDAAGYAFLPEISLEPPSRTLPEQDFSHDAELQREIREKIMRLDVPTARLCGFCCVRLRTGEARNAFLHGMKIKGGWFSEPAAPEATVLAVFSPEDEFCGLVEQSPQGRFSYKFVCG